MKKLISSFIIGSFLLPFSSTTTAKELAIKYQSTINSVVEIEMFTDDGQIFFGSGVIISVDGVILTAAHVVIDPSTKKPSEYINICPIKDEYSFPECKYSARVLAHDSSLDLALIYHGYELDENYEEIPSKYIGMKGAEALKLPYVDFADAPPSLGDTINFMGFPAGLGTLTYTQGKISSFALISNGVPGAYVTDAVINPGNSGGPAYDVDEKIVGIVSAVTTNQIGGNYGYIISSEQILLWFLKLVNQEVLSKEFVDQIFSNDFIKEVSETEIFSDVDIKNKNAEAISFLKKEGIISGYNDGTFKPSNTLNRAELLKILVTGLGLNPDETIYKNCFPDVKEEWYAKYICFAKEMEWVSGYEDGKFKPGNIINKAEALKILFESYGLESIVLEGLEKPFKDVSKESWFGRYVYTAQIDGILEETGDYYEPGKNITRAQISENLFRLLGVKEKENFLAAVESSICEMLTAYKKNKKISLNKLDKITIDTYNQYDLDIMDEALITKMENKYASEVEKIRTQAYQSCGNEKLKKEFLDYLFAE